jgi:hypothetical protein
VGDEQFAVGLEVMMDAQGTMRLMFDTMDAYDRGDFDRLAEIYAEDASWINADPQGPHCRNREDIFAMFRARMGSGIRISFDELRSTPTQVAVTARATDFGGSSVCHLPGRRIVAVRDCPSSTARSRLRAYRDGQMERSPWGRALILMDGGARFLHRDRPLERVSALRRWLLLGQDQGLQVALLPG